MTLSINETNHAATITCLSTNFYGTQLASASFDSFIRFYDLKTNIDEVTNVILNKSWIENTQLKIHHTFPVTNISWSHPEFGEFIAVAGYDSVVTIFKLTKNLSVANDVVSSKWSIVCNLTNSNSPITGRFSQE